MFVLDRRLEQDTFHLGDFKLCQLLLMNDSQYPWCILVPKVEAVSEIHQLTESQREQLAQESNWLAESMAQLFDADKMNTAALGNVVSQLHIHHIVRYKKDPAWPAPVWGAYSVKPYEEDELGKVKERLLNKFRQNMGFSTV